MWEEISEYQSVFVVGILLGWLELGHPRSLKEWAQWGAGDRMPAFSHNQELEHIKGKSLHFG